ncbi:MAG: histidine--tRNA ligase [Nitrososphaeria archaeon]
MRLDVPRGLRDIEPEEFDKMEWLREKFMETLDLFGFKKMEPSTIELLDILEAKSGPSIVDEIYYLKDKAGRELGLRFDLTVGISRYVCSRRDLEYPFKIGAFSSVWRYDEPQRGRYRWFYQWDAEIYGRPCIRSDAEIIELSKIYFEKVGLNDVRVELNDRRVIEEYIINVIGVKEEEVINELLRLLDKTTKKKEEEIILEYTSKGFPKKVVEEVLELAKISGNADNVLSEIEGKGLKNTGDLRKIVEELEVRGIRDFCINLGIVRGIDYYSGIVYEFYDPTISRLAIAGGGRYDRLMQVFGRSDLSATGAAGGVERMLMVLDQKGLTRIDKRKRIFVAFVTGELQNRAQTIVTELRKRGYAAEMDIYSRELKKQLAYASKYSSHTIILAPREDRENKCIIKDLETGSEERVEYTRIFEKLETLQKQ